MKKKIIITSVVLAIITTFIYFKYLFGWLEFKTNNYTQKENKSLVHVSKYEYSKDSLILVSVIKERIKNHKEPYTNAIRVKGKLEYINDSLTKIYIDSIFYSQDLKKVAFLVLVENENKKQYKGMTKAEVKELTKEGNLPYEGTFFDGNCFIAKKENSIFKSAYYGYSFTNSRTYIENSTALRNACLNQQKVENEKKLIYNVDDIRFWSTNIWDLIK